MIKLNVLFILAIVILLCPNFATGQDTIISVDPNTGQQGATNLAVTITGIATYFAQSTPTITIVFDIKPASCPSSVNIDSAGVTPFAVVGTEDLDVTMVDPESLVLTGPTGEELGSPIGWEIKDGTQPPEDGELCYGGEPYTDTDGDGVYDAYDEIPDLFFYFYTEDVAGILPEGLVHGDEVTLQLAGNLYGPDPQTPGPLIVGEDIMTIRRRR